MAASRGATPRTLTKDFLASSKLGGFERLDAFAIFRRGVELRSAHAGRLPAAAHAAAAAAGIGDAAAARRAVPTNRSEQMRMINLLCAGVRGRFIREATGVPISTRRRRRTSGLVMLRRLLLLFALLLAPALAEARGIEPQLVAEGPAPPGGEVELAIHMRTNPGWHGYWLNPGDAGLPMDVQMAASARLRGGAAALPGADAARDRRADELCLRARLCGAGAVEGAGRCEGLVPIRADARWLACTDKICVPESGSWRSTCRSAPGRPSARGSTSGGGRCRGRWRRRRVSSWRGQVAGRDPAAARHRGRPALRLSDHRRRGRLCRPAAFPAQRRHC